MGPSCAACLLAAWLTSAEDAAAPTDAAATTEAATLEAPTPDAPTSEPAPAPSPTRLALRDPFADPGSTIRYRTPVSPDLIDPFKRPPSSDAPARARDLRDPFESGTPARRCLPNLRGVPVQRPRQLPQTTAPCTIDAPLRNPFAPREPVTTS